MSLKTTYRYIAPFYDWAVTGAIDRARRMSLQNIPTEGCLDILIDGIGTGLDLRYLPARHRYVGTDLVAAMLDRARTRARGFRCELMRADSMALPFRGDTFDIVVLHLIVAVVPHPVKVLAEAARVVRRGGRLVILDKFLQPGRSAPLRRLLNPLASRIATRLDVVFEHLIAQVPGLNIVVDRPALAAGWFRSIVLEKN